MDEIELLREANRQKQALIEAQERPAYRRGEERGERMNKHPGCGLQPSWNSPRVAPSAVQQVVNWQAKAEELAGEYFRAETARLDLARRLEAVKARCQQSEWIVCQEVLNLIAS